MRPEGWHLVIIIVLALVLFGAPRLPGMARSLGQSLRIFTSEVRQLKEESTIPDTGIDPVTGRVVGRPVPPAASPSSEVPVRHPVHQPHQ